MSFASLAKSLDELLALGAMASFTVTGIYLTDAELADLKPLLGPDGTYMGVKLFATATFKKGDNSGVHLGIPYTLKSC